MQFSDDINLCSGIMNFCTSESLSFLEGNAKTLNTEKGLVMSVATGPRKL